MDYNAPLTLSDEEEEGRREPMDQLVEVLEETGKLLKDVHAWSMSNNTRRRVQSNFKLPKVPVTRTPHFDHFIRAATPQATKRLDKDLARIQTFGPLYCPGRVW